MISTSANISGKKTIANPIDILKVVPLICFILSIITEDNNVISNKKIGVFYVTNYKI